MQAGRGQTYPLWVGCRCWCNCRKVEIRERGDCWFGCEQGNHPFLTWRHHNEFNLVAVWAQALCEENARLKKLLAEAELEKAMLKELVAA